MARRTNLRGLIRVRRLLKRLPDETAGEIVVELSVTGRQLAAAILARTPKQTGFLAEGISSRVFPKTLRLQVGLLARRGYGGDPRFYGRIQDLGRKAQVVNVLRKSKAFRGQRTRADGSPITRLSRGAATRGQRREVGSPYKMQVTAKAGKRFVTGRYPDLRRMLGNNLRDIFGRALARAGAGSDE